MIIRLYKGVANFCSTLTSWQDLQSILINVSVSAVNYKIADLKKNSEQFLKDTMSDETSQELRDLRGYIKKTK